MAIDNQFEEDDDLEEEALDDDESGEGEGLDSKKILLMFVLPVFILMGIGAGLYFSGVLDKTSGGEKKVEKSHGKAGKGHGTMAVDAHFLEIPNMIVNLNSPDGQPRYLRLSVQLELSSEEDKAIVEAVMPRVVDQFQTYLRELRIQDLKGSKGVYRLQMELLNRVNAAAYPVEIQDVLFQEILIQ